MNILRACFKKKKKKEHTKSISFSEMNMGTSPLLYHKTIKNKWDKTKNILK